VAQSQSLIAHKHFNRSTHRYTIGLQITDVPLHQRTQPYVQLRTCEHGHTRQLHLGIRENANAADIVEFPLIVFITFSLTRKNCDVCTVSAGFTQARVSSGPHAPSGNTHWRRQDRYTKTVLFLCWVLNFDRSTVKHAIQSNWSDCQHWLSDSSRVHQIRFRPRLRPNHAGGGYSDSPDHMV